MFKTHWGYLLYYEVRVNFTPKNFYGRSQMVYPDFSKVPDVNIWKPDYPSITGFVTF